MAITVKNIPDTSYTLLDSDDGLLLRFSAATAVTVSCPDTILEGFTCEATQAGAGQVTFIKVGTTQFVDIREPVLRGTGAHCAITLDADALYKFNGEFTVATFLSLINKNAIIAPTVNDDETLSYSVGSTWFDNVAGNIYDCTDASTGAAVWKKRDTSVTYRTDLTTSITLTDNDDKSIIYCNNAGAITVTVDTGLKDAFSCKLIQKGAGAIGFAGTATLTGLSATVSANDWLEILPEGTDTYTVIGG